MKKLLGILFIVFSVGFTLWGVDYVKKSGLLKAYPDAVYMNENEIKNRIAYQNLSEEEKAVYTALYNGISAKSEYIELPYDVDGDVYNKIYLNLEKQEPEFFYLADNFYIAEKIRTARVAYKNDIESLDLKKSEIEQKCDEILADIQNYDDFEKALYIHDYLAENCVYIDFEQEYANTIYGCLVEENANCEGYAKTFKYLCDKADIPCIVVVGTSFDGTNHAWNQIKIDGNWYNIDVTWDDSDDEFEVVHFYFMASDDEFLTHYPDSSMMPVFDCTEKSQSYYLRNSLLISTQDDAERILAEKLRDISENIELKFSNEHAYNEFKNVYMTNRRIFDILTENNSELGNNRIRCLMKEFESNYVIVLKFISE